MHETTVRGMLNLRDVTRLVDRISTAYWTKGGASVSNDIYYLPKGRIFDYYDIESDMARALYSGFFNENMGQRPSLQQPLRERSDEFYARVTMYVNNSRSIRTNIYNKTLLEDILNGQIIPSRINEFIISSVRWDSNYSEVEFLNHMDNVLEEAGRRMSFPF